MHVRSTLVCANFILQGCLFHGVVSSMFRKIGFFSLIVKSTFYFPELTIYFVFEEYRNLCKNFEFLISFVTQREGENISKVSSCLIWRFESAKVSCLEKKMIKNQCTRSLGCTTTGISA